MSVLDWVNTAVKILKTNNLQEERCRFCGEGAQQKEVSPHEVVWTCGASLPFRCLYLLGGYRSVLEIIFTLELSCDQLCEALVT